MVVPHGAPDEQPDLANLQRDLQRFETDLRQLEIDYTMFFGGQRPRPPLDRRARVEAILRRWGQVSIPTTTERFRYNTLQLRFRTCATLWDRGMRAREEGRPDPFSHT